MPSSFIPQRIKRANQQITVKLYRDQLATLDSYGRFIDEQPGLHNQPGSRAGIQTGQRICPLVGAAGKC